MRDSNARPKQVRFAEDGKPVETSFNYSSSPKNYSNSPKPADYTGNIVSDDEENYADISENQWNDSMKQLSIREAPNLPIYTVPNLSQPHAYSSHYVPNFSQPPPSVDEYKDSNNKYYPLHRSNDSPICSGKAEGRSTSWAKLTPAILPRPSDQ